MEVVSVSVSALVRLGRGDVGRDGGSWGLFSDGGVDIVFACLTIGI